MIEINLLPEEFRVKAKAKGPQQAALNINKAGSKDQLFIYAIPLLLGLFICVHLYLAVVTIFKNGHLSSLNRKWVQLEPQKKAFDEFNQEFSAASQGAGLTRQLTGQRVIWAQKLNKLSLNLPAGVWFNDISINSQSITIQGSVISLQKEEVSLINKFLDNLKADAEFAKDFSGFELSNVQKRNIEGYDIADFVLKGGLNSK